MQFGTSGKGNNSINFLNPQMFLKQQYIFVESYSRDLFCPEFRIYCMKDLKNPIFEQTKDSARNKSNIQNMELQSI